MLEEDLSYKERLYVYRQRRRLTSWQHARELGVPYGQYYGWAHGLSEEGAPEMRLRGIDPGEHYMVLRLRAGMTRRKMCARLGISYWHLTEIERGNRTLKRLIEFWGS